MNSRARVLKSLSFEEPDRVPYDLASTTWTGITNAAYQKLLKYMGKSPEPANWSDVIQQIVIPSEQILNELQVDTRGLFPLTSSNWDVYGKSRDCGDHLEYLDEWGCKHHFPKDGYWYSLVKSPLEDLDFSQEDIVSNHPWPDAGNPVRFSGLRKQAETFRDQGKIVVSKGLCAGLFEMHQRIRGMENAMLDPFMFPDNSDRIVGRIADLKIKFWDGLLNEIGDVVDIVGEGDDYGTQQSQLISPDHFRTYYKPHFERVLSFIKEKAPHIKIIFHSCGNVREIIPDFIEMGIDILNPVHIKATGMEPKQLKKDFGDSMAFWGGGIDTQDVLPNGTPQEIKDHVARNIEALAPGGGFVFNTVHNIQAEVPVVNMVAMLEALQEYGKY